jgi:hydrogenase maturation protein HypF
MLPSTPLQILLLERVGKPLVMTSGNLSDEPIAITNREARARLAGIADAVLLHDREVVARYDDSVLRMVNEAPVFLRRARGYAPLPLALPVPAPVPLMAAGPHLKHTFALAQDAAAFVSQHIGDLDSLESLEHFRTTLAQYRALFGITPRVVVRDLHPGYRSTWVAEELARAPGVDRVLTVQHHHAHLAAVAAEHGVTGPVVALTFDGTGYGEDGCIWGAEVLVGDLTRFRRAGQLRYAPLPGGDLAVRRPWRAALGYRSLAPAADGPFARAFAGIPPDEFWMALRQIEHSINAPLASSMGRLFDAAAAVLGVRRVARYEGQAALELEALAGARSAPRDLPFPATEVDGCWHMDPIPLLAGLGEAAARGVPIPDLAAAFHSAVARTAAMVATAVGEAEGLDTVVLGGGVFQNARLLSETTRLLAAAGRRVLVPRRLSPNDGAISYGQAAVAAARLAAERSV